MKSTHSKGATLEQVVFTDDAVPGRRLVCTRFYDQPEWAVVGIEGDTQTVCYSGVRDRFTLSELEVLAHRWIEFGLPYL